MAVEPVASAPARLRVLVADDHPGVVRAVSRLLGPSCDIAGSVADGRGLLEAAERAQPDVIVLDVNLANGDGLRACREVTQAFPRMRVVIFTALDDPDVRRRALDAGASAFVHKLGVADDLLAAIRSLPG